MESNDENESQEVLEGRWTKDQHQRFLAGIIEYGKDWKIVEKVVKTRNGSQVRSHAQKFFIKLNKINKERRKCKNYSLIQPSDIQREILDLFKQQNITQNTPLQVSAVIRKDWTAVAAHFNQKKNKPKGSKTILKNKRKQSLENELQKKSKQQISQNLRAQNQQNQEQSYFIRVIKTNRDYFIKGHDFKQLIDFGQNFNVSNQQSLTNIMRAGQRKRSFCLPDDQNNQSKLKQTLDNLHRKMQGTG